MSKFCLGLMVFIHLLLPCKCIGGPVLVSDATRDNLSHYALKVTHYGDGSPFFSADLDPCPWGQGSVRFCFNLSDLPATEPERDVFLLTVQACDDFNCSEPYKGKLVRVISPSLIKYRLKQYDSLAMEP